MGWLRGTQPSHFFSAKQYVQKFRMTNPAPAIEVANVRKAFGATVALDGASFSVQRGTVHALLGENGAGKSTIVKMLSGLVRPDSGDICVFGEHCDISNPRTAHQLGIQTAFQEMTQIRDLTVVQNLLLPFEPVTALGTIRQREAEETVRDHLAAIGLGYIDPRRELRDLDLPNSAEDRDRACPLSQTAHFAFGRAHFESLWPGYRLARRPNRPGQG